MSKRYSGIIFKLLQFLFAKIKKNLYNRKSIMATEEGIEIPKEETKIWNKKQITIKTLDNIEVLIDLEVAKQSPLILSTLETLEKSNYHPLDSIPLWINAHILDRVVIWMQKTYQFQLRGVYYNDDDDDWYERYLPYFAEDLIELYFSAKYMRLYDLEHFVRDEFDERLHKAKSKKSHAHLIETFKQKAQLYSHFDFDIHYKDDFEEFNDISEA